jgi:hypothetical protein
VFDRWGFGTIFCVALAKPACPVSTEGLAALVREEIQADPPSGAIYVFRAKTGKLCAVEPQSYITDVITKIVDGHPNSQIDDLLP